MFFNIWDKIKKIGLRIKYFKNYCSGEESRKLGFSVPENPVNGLPFYSYPFWIMVLIFLSFPIFISWVFRKY